MFPFPLLSVPRYPGQSPSEGSSTHRSQRRGGRSFGRLANAPGGNPVSWP